MDRFAIKIDAALRKNLCKICRLCGIDNPKKVPILGDSNDVVDVDGDPGLGQKILDLLGLVISKNDKMPQTMCSLCVDKINDFYEFREMCYATNTQTRKLLGLKPQEPEFINKVDLKQEDVFCKVELSVPTPAKRGRKRKSDELMEYDYKDFNVDANLTNRKKKQSLNVKKPKQQQAKYTEIKDELPDMAEGVKGPKKYRKNCAICYESFDNKDALDMHKSVFHVPNVPRYICNACDQTHNTNMDIKAHQLWHKLSKTPYKCGLCDQLVANYYAFTRHLRDHAFVKPVAMLVYDRLCPKCRGAYPTNYLYNTHHCSIGTKQCGGCSKYLRNENEYMRHAPKCPKIYLTYNKHILCETAEAECPVRIKNENEIEAITEQDQSMQPFVSLTRLSSPMLLAATEPKNNNNMAKKTSKKDSKKDYLKRVDKLLKSTLDTLVSIKQEPEVHVDAEHSANESDGNGEDTVNDNDDDYQRGSESENSNDDNIRTEVAEAVQETTEKLITIKKEPEEFNQEVCNPMPAINVQIKEEPKTFALKLKITNKEGQLNSSLVDDDEGMHFEKRKKKKKRRDTEKQRSKEVNDDLNTELSNENDLNHSVQIKQEPCEDSYNYIEAACKIKQEPTAVMTSIPISQFEITCANNSGMFNSIHETEDIKPNRLELDRLITNIASGIDVAEEAVPVDKAVEVTTTRAIARKSTGALQQKHTSVTARKSTGAIRTGVMSSNPSSWKGTMPKIVAIQSGSKALFNSLANVVIKEEPMDRGYIDEINSMPNNENQAESGGNQSVNDFDYRNPIHYNNITIKQEKDIEVYDMDLDNNHTSAESTQNGINYAIYEDRIPPFDSSSKTDIDDEDDDETPSSTDEAEEAFEEEIHVYRDIDTGSMFMNNDRDGLMITSVCGQAEMTNVPNDKTIDAADKKTTNVATKSNNEVEADVNESPNILNIKKEIIEEDLLQEHSAVDAATLIEKTTVISNETNITATATNEEAANQVLSTNFGSFDVQKETESQAQPFFDTTDVPTDVSPDTNNSDSEEEQQNVLNHEISAQNIMPTLTTTPADSIEQPNSTDGPSTSGTQTAAVAAAVAAIEETTCLQTEETENRINEQQLVQQHQLQLESAPYRLLNSGNFAYEANINEIAENNNNANIERELLDENNASIEPDEDNAST